MVGKGFVDRFDDIRDRGIDVRGSFDRFDSINGIYKLCISI